MYDDAVIMVTGGTGSFGNAFVRHILKNHEPRKIIIFSRDEFKQFQMKNKLSEEFDENKLKCLRFFVGDVRDFDRLYFALDGVDHVFHAAALKQVVTAEYNPTECIRTNVMGTENLIRTSILCGVKKVVGVSTDKAVKPVNLYGATKACMERMMIAANHLSGRDGTKFGLVRYGNVIASRGSVIPLFREQAKTGRVTITHKDMTRFWLRIEDGVKFVTDCAEMMHGGEIFVKKLPSMAILDLAEVLAPGCKHEYIGIRPGEKLHEEMVCKEESLNTWDLDDMYVIQPSIKLWEEDKERTYRGKTGKKIEMPMSYNSGDNPERLTKEQLRKLLEETEVHSG